MKIALADRDSRGAEKAAELLSDTGAETMPITIDVTLPGDVEYLADRVYREYGGVHLLCNNAGVLGRVQPIWEQPLDNWRWVFDVNVFGVVNGLREFLPRMLEAKQEGYILNTASIAGMVTGPFFAPYNASKHAVVSLSECLHHELRELGSKVEVGVQELV